MRGRTPFPALALVAVVAVVVLVIVVAGGSGKTNSPSAAYGAQAAPSAPRAANSAVGVRTTPLGKLLVDAKGRTLYLFEADGPSVSRLPSAGLGVWPPFTAGRTPRAAGGAVAAQIGTTGPKAQVTYNGHPLYYFAGDRNPGDVAGQGLNQFGALWYVLSPAGSAITSSGTSSAGGGY